MNIAHRYSLTIAVTLLLLVAIGGPVLLAGCQPKVIEPVALGVNLGHSISRYVDTEAGIVCWVSSGGYAGGLSCLPIADTRLEP